MIEKLMRAVKSNNKKRGKNITIGAVVGMLLSCSAVMGADVVGLEIGKENDTIIFKDKNGALFTPDKEKDPYPNNEWDIEKNTYINNSTISAETTSVDIGIGIKLSGELKVNLTNNGIITASSSNYSPGYGYGIRINSLTGDLTNNGIITGYASVEASVEGYGYGIIIDFLTGNLTNNGVITGYASGEASVEGYGYGIYIDSSLTGNLINNGTIRGSGSGVGLNFGIRINSLTGDLTNNGTTTGSGSSYGYGIFINSLTGNLTNNGAIRGSGSNAGSSFGILIDSLTGNLTNNGIITGSGSSSCNVISIGSLTGNLTNNGTIRGSGSGYSYGYGILITSLTGNLTNNGAIRGSGSGSGSSFGIRINSLTGDLTNNGTITGYSSGSDYDSGYGISITSLTGNLTNTGVVYGKTNTIKIDSTVTTKSAYNCGLLVTDGSKAVEGKVDFAHNYGLAFKVGSDGTYTLDDDYSGKFGQISPNADVVIGYEKDAKGKLDFEKPITEKYTIVNAKSTNNNYDDIKTVSMELKNGILSHDGSEESEIEDFSLDKKYILNGITDTLKVSGMHNKLNNSVINAYRTAVVMGENNSMITLDNTVVNGGVAANSVTVNITGNENNFTVKGDSVINTGEGTTAIKVDGNNNAVVLSGNAIVNGKIESTGSNNILDLDGTGKDGMNMHHDISGFEKMAIDNNVTFFEDMKVTGTNEVTVEGTGVLYLRLKKSDVSFYNTIPTATHAFSENGEMTIKGTSSDEAGTLNFITNGIGREINVNMENISLKNMKIKASSIIDTAEIGEGYIRLGAGSDLGGIVNPKEVKRYNQLNSIYKSIYSSTDEKNLDELRDILNITYIGKNYDYNNIAEEEQLVNLLGYLNSIYTESPYSYSSELSRKSTGMFRDIVTENEFRPNLNNWLIMGGLTHTDGGTKDTYYGKNYYKIDSGSSATNADMKLTGAYMLAKYGYSENLSLGLTLGGNKSEAKLSMSKVKGNSGYLGAFAENYRGNLILKAGAGVQYSEYDADRRVIGGDSHSDKYSDIAYDVYLNGRYSNPMGDNLFLEPYATLSYTYVDQDGANEGSKVLAIETDSKSFDYTVGKVGVDLKKVIPHEKGKSTLTAGVSYTKILDGADEEYITGRFKGGSDFDILVAHKNEHSIGLNAKYALELENGVLFDIKGTYSVERDSHNGSGKNKTKGEWIVGAGMGYKF
ncbi:hypothetical protein M2102_001163 [Fusobacterium sp. PH5-7]|uniref:autotransporter outer membrane beta-barrel domain-containing protein n=1 Tax=Fusobacterium sp. PH5-7 TaxID=2940528 RepID=UPI0024734787|nr:autotransporter outer membrane beta-barrel domain-containing protein [Fusobacterium sp. PH5-7]MDH6457535.1 hypothetical protein [Fusobacterium sp. PH5-7]